jgi:hypothetical protein
LLAYLGQQRGVNGVPLSYDVRNDDDHPEELDEVQDEIWNSPLSGTYFNNDSYTVFQILRQWTAEGVADTHVDRYSDSSDGRAAYQILVATYEGDDARQSAIAKARSQFQMCIILEIVQISLLMIIVTSILQQIMSYYKGKFH